MKKKDNLMIKPPAYLVILIERPGGLPEHELQLAQSPPPDAGVPGLELGLALVQEVDQVSGDGQQHRLGGNLRRG